MQEAVIASPCVDVCIMDAAHGLCTGCQRTLEEIANWIEYTPAQKREVLARVKARRAAAAISH